MTNNNFTKILLNMTISIQGDSFIVNTHYLFKNYEKKYTNKHDILYSI